MRSYRCEMLSLAVSKSSRRRSCAPQGGADNRRHAAKAETQLSKSLKKSRADVQDAYGKGVVRYGSGFADGDVEAHSTLSAILFRLNAGFVSVIERFMRGQSSANDYQTLVSLSNISSTEAIQTFKHLSHRLSRTPALPSRVPSTPARHIGEKQRRKKKSKKSSAGSSSKRGKSSSSLQLSVAPLGMATSEGWVRPKTGRKTSTVSSASEKSRTASPSQHRPGTKTLAAPKSHLLPAVRRPLETIPANHPQFTSHSSMPDLSHANERPRPPRQQHPQLPQAAAPKIHHPQTHPQAPIHPQQTNQYQKPRFSGNRMSIRSFASDSTKLGEIPEHKWARFHHQQPQQQQQPLAAAATSSSYSDSNINGSGRRSLWRFPCLCSLPA